MPTLAFTAKEIHIIVQLIRVATEEDLISAYAKKSELEALRAKLQSVRDV